MSIETGKTYEITHSRKGKFTAQIENIDEGWADVTITKGEAYNMSSDNNVTGETITIRISQIIMTVEVRP